MRRVSGWVATAVLRRLAFLPPHVIITLGGSVLPLYALIQVGLRRRLDAMRGKMPFTVPTRLEYYRMRLRLAALSLRHLVGKTGDIAIRIDGREHYRSALRSGRPVVLLGWHQGPLELLHRLPPPPDDGRPFQILMTGTFSAALTRFLEAGRTQPGKSVIHASNPGALRAWVRQKGVLAVMVDQLPGKSREAIQLWDGTFNLPCPLRLLEFLETQGAVAVPVSVRLEKGGIRFRYHPALTFPLAQALRPLLENALSGAPDQYNWSYPKIRTRP